MYYVEYEAGKLLSSGYTEQIADILRGIVGSWRYASSLGDETKYLDENAQSGHALYVREDISGPHVTLYTVCYASQQGEIQCVQWCHSLNEACESYDDMRNTFVLRHDDITSPGGKVYCYYGYRTLPELRALCA